MEKLVKSETPSCGFAKVGIQGGEIAWNVVKVGVHSCLSNGNSNFFSNINSKKSLKIETPSYGFDRVGIKGVKTDPNVVKVVCNLVIQCASESMI